MNFDIRDINLAKEGRNKIEWAAMEMPVLKGIKKDFLKNKPLKNLTVGACLHVTSETANLMITLKEGGANVALCASNPLSTQDDVASSLVKDFKISVFAVKGEDNKTYYKHINSILDTGPQITMDDGADLISTIHSSRKELLKGVYGGTEETTTGVIRLRSMEKKGVLFYPIIAVNDAKTKHFFDNRYGTGQSTIDGILRATNILLAGKKFVIAGYGWCGRGVAMRAKGMGASVVILEVDPLRALEAKLDGFDVMNSSEAAKVGDIFLSVSGDKNAIGREILENCRDNVILANSGHFDVEIDLGYLKANSKSKRKIRPFVEEYLMKDGRKLYVLAEGRLVNLSAAEGHPASVMDMSFANQALSAQWLSKKENVKKLEKQVYPVPKEIDEEIALLKLKTMNIDIDRLSKTQIEYMNSWKEGT